jgi:calcineurin-like phosphoesterase family protein
MEYFTSDSHFNHIKILEYEASSRPFKTTQEMDEVLIDNWNKVVAPNDVVYHLGDFMMGQRDTAPLYRQRLNGKIVLIVGNHDIGRHHRIHDSLATAGFDEICKGKTITINGMNVLLSHVPNMPFVPSDKANIHLCGHVHGSWTRVGPIINCGVDVCGLKPMSFEELLVQPETKGHSHRGY